VQRAGILLASPRPAGTALPEGTIRAFGARRPWHLANGALAAT
jgi:hypothetical protein